MRPRQSAEEGHADDDGSGCGRLVVGDDDQENTEEQQHHEEDPEAVVVDRRCHEVGTSPFDVVQDETGDQSQPTAATATIISSVQNALRSIWEDLQRHRRRQGRREQHKRRRQRDRSAEYHQTSSENDGDGDRGGEAENSTTATMHMPPSESTLTFKHPAVFALLFGQVVALVATSMNAASFTLEQKYNSVFPFFLMLPCYVCLSLHLLPCVRTVDNGSGNESEDDDGSISSQQQQQQRYQFLGGMIQLRTPWWCYLCLSVLDIGPNYLTLMAMNLTTLTSATLLGSLTIPSTMLFCFLILRKQYKFFHYVGVSCVMVGGTLTILTDRSSRNDGDGDGDGNSDSHPYSYLGDILAVLAALGYGVGDAAAEFWSKHVDRKEYLGMLGLFGSMFTFLLFLVLELPQVTEFFFRPANELRPALMVIGWYIISLVAYYINESLFLKGSDATLLNLSLQSSQFYAILFSVLAFHEQPPPQFYMAVACVVLGVFIYELCGNGKEDQRKTPMRQTTAQFSDTSPELSPIVQRNSNPSTSIVASEDYESIETTSLVHTTSHEA